MTEDEAKQLAELLNKAIAEHKIRCCTFRNNGDERDPEYEEEQFEIQLTKASHVANTVFIEADPIPV